MEYCMNQESEKEIKENFEYVMKNISKYSKEQRK